MGKVSLETLHREIMRLRKDVDELRMVVIPEAVPEEDEVLAAKEASQAFKKRQFVEWRQVKSRTWALICATRLFSHTGPSGILTGFPSKLRVEFPASYM